MAYTNAYYWYQADPGLYQAEVRAMQRFFPSFTIHQLQDGTGRLYWRGTVQPTGPGGIEWDLILIYKNDHPHTAQGEYGGSVQILPLKPRLKDLAARIPASAHPADSFPLPHIYRGNFGPNEEYFICTADPRYFKASQSRSTSAASALSWACKWIMLCEMWLNGEISNEIFNENSY